LSLNEAAVGERLRRLREGKKLTRAAVARRARLGPDDLERIETGESDPTLGELRRLAEALEIPLAEVLALPPAPIACEVRLHPASERAARALAADFIPVPWVSGEAAGGNARIVDESVLGWLFLPREEFAHRSSDLVAVRIYGKSMEPELPDGCLAVVDRGDRAPSPEGIFALREPDGGCTVKRVQVFDQEHIALIPSNRSEFKVEFWKLAPGEALADRLIGRVVWVGFNLLEQAQAAERQPPYGRGGSGLPPPRRGRKDEEPF